MSTLPDESQSAGSLNSSSRFSRSTEDDVILCGCFCYWCSWEQERGCFGYRALEDFSRRHHDALVASLQLPPTRFPSDSTFRRIMMGIDFTELANVFNNWANDWMPTQEQDWLGVDGKSIKATLSNYAQTYQDFINVVSVFNTRCGVAIAKRCCEAQIALKQFHNKQSSEIAIVQALLATLKLEGVVFTFDALHCQKKQ